MHGYIRDEGLNHRDDHDRGLLHRDYHDQGLIGLLHP